MSPPILVRNCLLLMNSSKDVGTNVRKRIVRLLKDIYLHVAELEGEQHRKITVDIAAKLLGRLSDEEDSVKVCGSL